MLFLVTCAQIPPHFKYRQKFCHNRKLDFRVLDVFYKEGFVDLAPLSFAPSVPTRIDSQLDWMNKHHEMRLDYVLGTSALASTVVNGGCVVHRSEATHKLSDHYPVVCHFSFPRLK